MLVISLIQYFFTKHHASSEDDAFVEFMEVGCLVHFVSFLELLSVFEQKLTRFYDKHVLRVIIGRVSDHLVNDHLHSLKSAVNPEIVSRVMVLEKDWEDWV